MVSIHFLALATSVFAPHSDDPGELARPWLVPVIARGGDVDLDGANEFLVADAANTWDLRSPADHVGRAWVISGVTGKILLELRDGEIGDGFGVAACGLGDVDGDWRADWVVAAPGSEARPYGRAIVFSGATGAKLFEVASARADDGFGAALCDVGDLDGDSIDDFAVGAQRSDHGGVGAGSVSFFSGRDGRLLGECACRGTSMDSRMHLERLRDLDDGRSELAIGTHHFVTDFDAGVSVLAGSADSTAAFAPKIRTSLSRSRGALVIANGDCRPTRELWCIGESSIERASLANSAFAPPIDFAESDAEAAHRASLISDWANLGDVNGDGCDDVAIGFQWTGVAEGRVRVVSGLDGRTLYSEDASAELWWFGASVVALGDIDGDHVGDFAVGCDHTMSHEPGEVRVYSGRDGKFLWFIRLDRGELRVR